eukprot:scaffold65954_cov47-Prasinocladus_malaysianus.AAC.7
MIPVHSWLSRFEQHQNTNGTECPAGLPSRRALETIITKASSNRPTTRTVRSRAVQACRRNGVTSTTKTEQIFMTSS